MKTTIDLLKAYLNYYFTEHCPEKILSIVTDDIHCYGLAEDRKIESLAEAKAMLLEPVYKSFMDLKLDVWEETDISEDNAAIAYTLSTDAADVSYRLSGSSRVTEGERKLSLLHFSVISPHQKLSLFSDIAESRLNSTRQELLDAATAGGMMGGYIGEGFPFYYVNRRMLDYLGYIDEEDFVEGIGGLIINCMHPDDRQRVDEETLKGISEKGEYQVEYRMQKKDGTYIWVHDIGKKIKAENGRDAILSVCYDITKDKDHSILVENLVDTMNGGMVLYSVDKDWKLHPIYVSAGVGNVSGRSNEEYYELCSQDVMDSVHPDDREYVQHAFIEAITEDKVTSLTYRVPGKGEAYVWINGMFSAYGEREGKPVLRAVFTPASVQYDLQLQALNQNSTGVCVIDADSCEVYYANNAVFRLYGVEHSDYNGRNCQDLFFPENDGCGVCLCELGKDGDAADRSINIGGRVLAIHSERNTWNGRKVVVEYLRDVTEQHSLHRKIEATNRELEAILRNVACGFCVCNISPTEEITIKYFSDGFSTLYEGDKDILLKIYSENPMYGVHADDIMAVNDFMRKTIMSHSSGEIAYRCRTLKGKQIWVMLKLNTIPESDGSLTTYATYMDITERMFAEQQLADMVHNIPGGICMYKWNGEKLIPLVIGKQFSELYGIDGGFEKMSQAQGLYYPLVHPDDLPGLQNFIIEGIKTPGVEQSFVYRAWNKEKHKYLWISMHAIAIKQDDDSLLIYSSYRDITTEKENEEQLIRDEEMNELACDLAGMWTFIFRTETGICYPCKKLQKEFGLPEVVENFPDGVLKYGYMSPESELIYRENVEKIKNGEDQVEFEIPVHYPDKSTHWLRYKFLTVKSGGRADRYAVASAVPIDTEKQLEAKIEVERQKTVGADSSLLGYFITNLSKNTVIEHKALHADAPTTTDGISFSDAIENALGTVYDEEERAYFRAIHSRDWLISQYSVGKNSMQMESRRVTPKNNIMWIRNTMSVLEDPATGDLMLYEYAYNIHSQKMFEELMSAAVEYGYERCGGISLDMDQISIIYSEREAGSRQVAITAYSKVYKHYCETSVYEEDREEFLRCSSLEYIREHAEISDNFEFSHRTLENGMIHYKKNMFYVYNRAKSICLFVRSDITDLVNAEREKRNQLQAALDAAEQATLAKSEFLSRMSHEIRTPMNAIMGMTAIAQENRSDYVQVSECLDKIDMSSHYLLTLINDILEMSRIESGQMEIAHREFDYKFLMESIRTIVETLAIKSGIRYEFVDSPDAESHYIGDMMRIQQVLVNIISNAIKFTKSSGKVRFAVNIDSCTAKTAKFRFTVSDTGIGMSKAFMTRMFQPFTQEDSTTTSRYSGSGLGLSICKNLTEAMGGSISAESYVGVGTTFTVELPLDRITEIHEEQPEEKTPQLQNTEISLEGKVILMAEDHPLNVMVATKLLERKGMQVIVAENGKIAVEKFSISEPGFFDAILMDIRMPVMDGLDATRTIRSLDKADAKTVPIIAMTANALEEDRRHSGEAGMNAHLAKPFEPAQLYSVLAEQISKKDQVE